MTAKTTSRSSAPALAGERYVENKLKHDVRVSNMTAAKKLADAIRISRTERDG